MSLEVFHHPSEAELGDARMVALWSYWRGLCDGHALPSRMMIEPEELKPVLPWVFLIDVHGEGGFRYRLVGTAIVEEMGYDMTGQLVSNAYAGRDWDDVLKDYRYVIDRKRPCLTVNSVLLEPSGQRYSYSRLLLPLAADGTSVDMLLGAAIARD
ncbi:PAS domain-containing protein [Minwuia sp.]|uniref:PAS domain-containing protein n=1 Tax=Minwuia sp. TaxID=2493630 RepID=UPI003A9038D8